MIFNLFKRSTDGLYEDLDATAFKTGMEQNKNAVVLDVRSLPETRSGKIKGAAVIDFMSPGFAAAVAKLDKEKHYYLYCRSGNRSARACRLMAEQGFKHLYNLKGGMMDWPY